MQTNTISSERQKKIYTLYNHAHVCNIRTWIYVNKPNVGKMQTKIEEEKWFAFTMVPFLHSIQ